MCDQEVTVRAINALSHWFSSIDTCVIAASGGIDSTLLSYIAHQALENRVLIAHSSSSAVPHTDRERIGQYARRYGWTFSQVNAGELEDENYIDNPVNRCYFCKKCLFSSLKKLNHGLIVTGTNIDDLTDYRPGLIAAKEYGIRQPYVELGIDKATIRAMATYFNLDDLKDIPSSPCLASRIETGIKVNAKDLNIIDQVESKFKSLLKTKILRFRLHAQKTVLEIDKDTLRRLSKEKKNKIISDITSILSETAHGYKLVEISTYSRGSSFIGEKIPVVTDYE
ncbi:hypothetical protein ACL2XP_09060 [Sodalis sp. RH21]|uniref:hypothetical protein n=1 Tax=unclassified Sodalis (in: enterobacteria) TaxID=2636512 RepID=UPI0039B69039